MGRTQFGTCRFHLGICQDLFCEQCRMPICIQCHRSWHRGHKFTDMRIKTQETEEKMKLFLSEGKKQSQRIQDRSLALKQCRDEVETSATSAIERLIQQRDQIQQEIATACSEQENKMNKSKQELLAKLDQEEIQLQNCTEHWEHLEKRAEKLLSGSRASDFISQCYAFLSNQPKSLPSKSDVTTGRLRYREPLSSQAFSADELPVFLQDNLLGFFTSQQESNTISGNAKDTSSFTESLRSATSITGHSFDTYISNRSNLSHVSHRPIDTMSSMCPSIDETAEPELQFMVQPRITAAFGTETDIKSFTGSHLKAFFSILFKGGSLWICGWNQNMFFSNDTVLVNVTLPDYSLLTKEKMKDPQAHEQTIMFPFGECILFAKKDGNKVYNFNTQSRRFKDVFSGAKLNITALCGSDNQIFILDNKQPDNIQILDSAFRAEGKIATGLTNVKDCNMDMCLIDEQYKSSTNPKKHSPNKSYIVVISTFTPCPCVRAISQSHGLIWELDYRTSSLIDIRFDPCSVSASEKGDVFIADRGTNRASVELNIVETCY